MAHALFRFRGVLFLVAMLSSPLRGAELLQIPVESARLDDIRVLQAAHWMPVANSVNVVPEPIDDVLTSEQSPISTIAPKRARAAETGNHSAIPPLGNRQPTLPLGDSLPNDSVQSSGVPTLPDENEPAPFRPQPLQNEPSDVGDGALSVANPQAVPPSIDPKLPRWTLAELEQIALQQNPTLAQAQMLVSAAEGERIQVGLYPNPTLNYVGDEMGDSGSAGQQGAAFGQEIVTTGKLQKRQAVATQEIVQAQAAVRSQRLRVLNAVKIHWFEVLQAQRAVELHEQLYQIGQRGVTSAEKLLAAKEVSRVDVLQLKIESESAKVQLVNATNHNQAAWRRLAAVLGEPDMPPACLDGSLDAAVPEFEFNALLERLMQQSPQLCQARAGVRRAQANVASQTADRLPNVEVRGGVRYMSGSKSTIGMMEFGSEIPLFSRNQGNIVKSQASLISACKEVERLELLLRQRLATAYQDYANAKQESHRYASEIVPNAKESLELIAGGYRQGEFGYLTLLTAQRTYFRVSLEYLDALLRYQTNAVELEGLLMTGGLAKVDMTD